MDCTRVRVSLPRTVVRLSYSQSVNGRSAARDAVRLCQVHVRERCGPASSKTGPLCRGAYDTEMQRLESRQAQGLDSVFGPTIT